MTVQRNLALRWTVSIVVIIMSLTIYSAVKGTDLMPTLLKVGLPLFVVGALADVVFSFSDAGAGKRQSRDPEAEAEAESTDA